MSGPKVDSFELERRRQEALTQARIAREADLSKALMNWHELHRAVDACGLAIASETLHSVGVDGCGGIDSFRKELQREQLAFESLCKAIKEQALPDASEDDPTGKTSNQAAAIRALTVKLRQRLETEKGRHQRAYDEICIRSAASELESLRNSLRSQRRDAQTQGQKTLAALGGAQEMAQVEAQLKKSFQDLHTESERLFSVAIPRDVPSISELIRTTAQTFPRLVGKYQETCRLSLSRGKEFQKSLDKIAGMESVLAQTAAVGKPSFKPVNLEDIIFAAPATNDRRGDREKAALQEVAGVLAQIESLINSDCVLPSDEKQLLRSYEAICNAMQQQNGSVFARVCQAQLMLHEIQARADSFESAYQAYYAAVTLFLQRYGAGYPELVMKNRSSFDSLSGLNEETQYVRCLCDKEDERAYIRRQIDEVMQQFGFLTAEEIVLVDSTRGQNYLCKEKTGNAAIHIHVSGQGKKRIMMQVVGTRRKPKAQHGRSGTDFVTHEDLSEEQNRALLERQGAFCTIHPQIVAELQKRGIMMNTQIHNPPSLSFCKELCIEAGSEREKCRAVAGDEHRPGRTVLAEMAIQNGRRIRA